MSELFWTSKCLISNVINIAINHNYLGKHLKTNLRTVINIEKDLSAQYYKINRAIQWIRWRIAIEIKTNVFLVTFITCSKCGKLKSEMVFQGRRFNVLNTPRRAINFESFFESQTLQNIFFCHINWIGVRIAFKAPR